MTDKQGHRAFREEVHKVAGVELSYGIIHLMRWENGVWLGGLDTRSPVRALLSLHVGHSNFSRRWKAVVAIAE